MAELKLLFLLLFLSSVSFLSSCKNATGPGALGPNLVLDDLTGSLSATSASYAIVVKNTGRGFAPASRLRIVFESRDMDTPAYWLLDQRDYPIPTILPGASYTHTYSREGSYHRGYDFIYTFTAIADPYNVMIETDESDNHSSLMKWVFGAIRYTPSWKGAPVGTDLTIEFSDPVVRGSGSIIIRRVSDDSVFEAIDVTSDQVTITNTTVVIDPNGVFEPLTDYRVEYADTCFDDDKGNSFDSGWWGFTTWSSVQNHSHFTSGR